MVIERTILHSFYDCELMKQPVSVAYNPISITNDTILFLLFSLKYLETLKEPHGMAEQSVNTSDLDVTLDHWIPGSSGSRRAMAPNRRKVVASRHLVCGNCRSWIQFESSGCGRTWAETRGESFAFTCKGCTEVTALEKEVEGLRQMVEDMMEKVAGLRFEDKAAETEGSVTTTGVNQDREESAGNIRKEEMIAGVEDEGEIRTEERKVICAGATLMATHTYTRNPESPLGKEIDLQQWDTLIFKGEHAENEHWRLVEDRNGQVGYAPAAFLVVILDTAEEEEESDATKKGLENSTEENRIGQEGERRKSYSAAVIDGIKRKSRIFVGDYSSEDRYKIEQGGGRSRVFTGSKDRACDRESREDHGKRKGRDHTGTHRDE